MDKFTLTRGELRHLLAALSTQIRSVHGRRVTLAQTGSLHPQRFKRGELEAELSTMDRNRTELERLRYRVSCRIDELTP
jgi:hypothetical protein